MKNWHKVVFGLSFTLIIISWAVALYYWDKLPSIIPTHFGISGQPDTWSEKTIFYSFLIPLVQTIMYFVFLFLYYKPQYSNMPTTLWLTTLEEKKKSHAFSLIRTMNTTVLFWMSTFFAYLSYEMNKSALNGGGLNPWIMIIMIALIIFWLIFWNINIYKLTKEEMKR